MFVLVMSAIISLTAPQTQMPQREIRTLLHSVGWRGDDLTTATRYVIAESNGKPWVIGVNRNGSRDHGLFQINDRTWRKYTRHVDLMQPMQNAAFAFAIYKRYGFKPWKASRRKVSEAIGLSVASTTVNAQNSD